MKFLSSLLAICLVAAGATWKFAMPVLDRGPAGAFDETAVKDPSIVRYGGRWHVFYTARGHGQYSLGYVSAAELEDLNGAPRRRIGGAGYAAAPQVFYFRPQQRWYLIYQTTASNYQPVYAVTPTIERPESWSASRPLVEKQEKDKWIDFWVICDDRLAWLFYTRNQSEVWAMTTPIEQFPKGFSGARKVLSGVHEAVHVYKEQGAASYAMLYEVNGAGGWRSFGLARARELGGDWKVADSAFAAHLNGTWSRDISHGELIRKGYDERLEAEIGRARFLVQGMPALDHRGEYTELPWRLGLIQNY